MFVLLLALAAVLLVYKFLIKPHRHWENVGISHEKPTFLFGNWLDVLLGRVDFPTMIQRMYNNHKNDRYFGWYSFLQPTLMINDLDLIKRLAIKDFDSFSQHQPVASEDIDILWCMNLFGSTGEKWKQLRTTLSPSFTGSKMRIMFGLMQDCARQVTSHIAESGETVMAVKMKDLFSRYTNDVIATCALGVQCDSLKQRDNECYTNGSEVSDFSGLKAFRIFIYQASPLLMKMFNIKIFTQSSAEFFRKIVSDAIRLREERGIIRPDLIHLLMEAKKNGTLNDDDITAQVLIFYVAGFDTASTLMSYLAYELALNKEIQQRLREEIEETAKKCDGDFDYDAIMNMKYLDMIISETLRKWPPTVLTDRYCTRDYTFEPELQHEKAFTIKAGTIIWFPSYAIQRDPRYFPDPDKFDPERFNPENDDKIHPAAITSFGIGPRSCIGSRFALMENKIIIVELLRHFEIVPVKETAVPLVFSKRYFNLEVENGMWLGFKKLQS